MIKSMTGFAKTIKQNEDYKLTLEARCLNSKQLDLNIKLPYRFKEKESEIRCKISPIVERGKLDLFINFENVNSEKNENIFNSEAIKNAFDNLNKIAQELNVVSSERTFLTAVRYAETNNISDISIDETEIKMLNEALIELLETFNKFRVDEGKVLGDDIHNRIQLISKYLDFIKDIEPKRKEKIKQRINENLIEVIGFNNIDKNRFEQELIYYIEKIDITEEMVRLKKHLQSFLLCMNETNNNGKKLGFITQEIGREINTIGSKANDAEIQHHVVNMKDELEKVKEQLLNIL